MNNFRSFLISITVPILLACSTINPQAQGTKPISHQLWSQLLKKHVDDHGFVDYEGFQKDSAALKTYLSLLQTQAPSKYWTEDEQLAYWINAYNAFTVRLILDHYPVKSIKDIGSILKIPFVSTAWDIKFIEIAEERLTLNNIEHNIIRKVFDEPRIHFALVCAAKSCPKLRNEAYQADHLDWQLSDQAKSFLANKSKNQISRNELKLSKLFNWYGGDFTKESSLIDYLNQYTLIQISPNAKKSFMDYDWSLNE